MKRKYVSSSTIASAGYNPDMQILELEFISGEVYRYHDVPEYLYAGLVNAASKGKYFNRYIKETYRFSGPL